MEEGVQTPSTNATSALLLNTTTSLSIANPPLNNTASLSMAKTLHTAAEQHQQWDETTTVVSPPIPPCQQIA